MKGFEVSFAAVMAVVLAGVVLAFFVQFLISTKVQSATSGYVAPKQVGECKTTAECSPYGVCMEINGGRSFCGCLSDTDCAGRTCNNYRCV
jgi:hypothetical protein